MARDSDCTGLAFFSITSYTDEEFVQARITRLQTFLHALENIREKYGENTDLLRMDALVHASGPESLLQALLAIQNQAEKEAKRTPNLEDSKTPETVLRDMWTDIFARPRLRLQAAIGRAYVDTARFKLAATTSLTVNYATVEETNG